MNATLKTQKTSSKKVKNELTNAITQPKKTKVIKLPLLTIYKKDISTFETSKDVTKLISLKDRINISFYEKKLTSKDKNDLLKSINKIVSILKTEVKVSEILTKESTKKELTDKQKFVKDVNELSRPLSHIIKSIKDVNATNERYNFIFKRDFTLALINSFYSLSQFSNLLTKGNFHTETSIVTILDKIEKITDNLILEFHLERGRKINELIKAHKEGINNLETSLNLFIELMK